MCVYIGRQVYARAGLCMNVHILQWLCSNNLLRTETPSHSPRPVSCPDSCGDRVPLMLPACLPPTPLQCSPSPWPKRTAGRTFWYSLVWAGLGTVVLFPNLRSLETLHEQPHFLSSWLHLLIGTSNLQEAFPAAGRAAAKSIHSSSPSSSSSSSSRQQHPSNWVSSPLNLLSYQKRRGIRPC